MQKYKDMFRMKAFTLSNGLTHVANSLSNIFRMEAFQDM